MVCWGGLGLAGLPAGDGAETGWTSHRGAGEGAERRAAGGPSGGWPATCRVHGPKALAGGPARMQVPPSTSRSATQDAVRRQRREGRHGGRPVLSVAPSHLHLHSPHTAGVSHGLGGSGRTSQASSARDAPCTRARPLCRPQGLHTARCRGRHAHPGAPQQAAATPCTPDSWQVARGGAESS